MKKLILLTAVAVIGIQVFAQDKTDASLFMRSDSAIYLDVVKSETGDLYSAIGHHGPAVENEWIGLRIYFNHKCAIDVYNKTRPGLELRKERWYPDEDQQRRGWGADYYKVGSTVGLGGVRLWDGEKVIKLDPVSQRIARVNKEKDLASMEMLSEGVLYMGKKVDILFRVSVFPDSRWASVEAEVLNGGPVQFVTGINYHKGQQLEQMEGLIVTWGEHPEDVAAEIVKIGGAIRYHPSEFEKVVDDGKQILLISKPAYTIKTQITSACAREPELNSMEAFLEFLKN